MIRTLLLATALATATAFAAAAEPAENPDQDCDDIMVELKELTDAVTKDKERFFGWRLQKQQEEQKIANTVSYFVTENPITTAGSAASQPGLPKGSES